MPHDNMNYKTRVREEVKDREKKAMLKARYDVRITNVKLGKAAFQSGDFITAIRKYTEYLELLAEANRLSGNYEIRPEHFDKSKELTEMMMLSHLYYELAKVYDATGKFPQDVEECLKQFVIFSINQPYQAVNSELARKHLNKFKFRDHQAFANAYRQIYVQSRKCYVATHCLGDHHPTTEKLRLFRQWLLDLPFGLTLVRWYYRHSPRLVILLESHPRFNQVFLFLTKPCLHLLGRLSPKKRGAA